MIQHSSLVLEAYNIGKNEGKEEYPHNILMGIYLEQNKRNSALKVLDTALTLYTKQNKIFLRSTVLNNMGMCHMFFEEYERALIYFNRALADTKPTLDGTLFKVSIIDNMASSEYKLGHVQQSLLLWSANLKTIDSLKSIGNQGILRHLGNAYLSLVQCYLAKSDNESAFTLLNKYEANLAQNSTQELSEKIRSTRLWIKYFISTQQLSKIILQQDLLVALYDEQHRLDVERISEVSVAIARLERMNFDRQLNLQNKLSLSELEMQRAKSHAKFVHIFSLLIVLVILVGLIYFAQRRRLKEEANRVKLLSAEKQFLDMKADNDALTIQKMQLDIDFKRKDLEWLALDISRKKQWIEQLYNSSKMLKSKGQESYITYIDELVHQFRKELIIDNGRLELQSRVDEAGAHFYHKLNSHYPDLTQSESELCGLIRINFSNKEIATIRNISPKSVRMAKYRLKQRLKLGVQDSIYTFISNL